MYMCHNVSMVCPPVTRLGVCERIWASRLKAGGAGLGIDSQSDFEAVVVCRGQGHGIKEVPCLPMLSVEASVGVEF